MASKLQLLELFQQKNFFNCQQISTHKNRETEGKTASETYNLIET